MNRGSPATPAVPITLDQLPTPVIAGPTAGGKSDLAVDLAVAVRDRFALEAEVITADAFQVYRGMDIGTAKPTTAERRGVPHHLVDLRSALAPPDGMCAAPFTVDDWLTLARRTMDDLRARGVLPIAVGGTHLYIKALLDGLFEGPDPDPALRAELNAMEPGVRRAELERVDPAAAARIHPNDTRRTVRALEVFRLTGRPISDHQRQWDRPSPERGPRSGEHLLVILDWEVEALNRRINARVKSMVERGLLDEIRQLLAAAPAGLVPQAAEALGYKQVLPLLAPGRPWPPPAAALEEAVEKIKIETRRFAKNQRTWLRRLRTTPGAVGITCPPVPGEGAVGQILAKMAEHAP